MNKYIKTIDSSLQFPRTKLLNSRLLLIQSPPSYPINFLSSALHSFYYGAGDFKQLVTWKLKRYNVLNSLFGGKLPLEYQEIVSTVPFNLVLSSGEGSFHELELDGTIDWAVYPRNALQIFSGNNLAIRYYTSPSRVSRKLAKYLNVSRATKTGYPSSYTFISGRGNIGLVGQGEVFQVELADKESLMVNKNNLMAVSVNGTDGLSSLSYSQDIVPVEETRVVVKETSYWQTINRYATGIFSAAKKIALLIYNWRTSKNNFLTLVGPTTVLLQSSCGTNKHTKLGINNKAAKDLNVQNEDRLSYVTMKDGKAEFSSTKTFRN